MGWVITRLGLAVLRAKNVAMRDVADGEKGIAVETRERPGIISPPESGASDKHKMLSQMHVVCAKLETPSFALDWHSRRVLAWRLSNTRDNALALRCGRGFLH